MKQNIICNRFKHWCDKNPNMPFKLTDLYESMKITENKDQKALYACITSWRKKFKNFYSEQERQGVLHGNPNQKYTLCLINFERNFGMHPFWYDRLCGEYYVPNLADKQDIDEIRFRNWINASNSVIDDMILYGEVLPISGKKPLEIAGDLNVITKKINGMEEFTKRCPTCGDMIQDNWVSCPSCGEIELN